MLAGNLSLLRHRFWSITSGQNASAIAQFNQPARILGHPAAIDRPGNREVVVPVNNLLLTSAFAALFKQLDGILAFSHGRLFLTLKMTLD
jgi:hypothetical protein